MKMIEMLLAELNRETPRSRRALAEVPEGKFDWKPHEKSMTFGYLTNMIATIPSWIAMAINLEELDIKPKEGSQLQQMHLDSSTQLIDALEKSVVQAKQALTGTTEEHLNSSWRLLAAGQQVMQTPRHIVI